MASHDGDRPTDPATCPTPVRRAAMVQSWNELTFLHWRYEPATVQSLLPSGLEIETMDGSAWVGLVPFFLEVGLPHLVDGVPWASRFAETNVRTYVRSTATGDRGIWFFSLDAARLGAVLVARATYRIPYFWSHLELETIGATERRYTCRRRWPGPSGASSHVRVDVGERFATQQLDELDHFLTARWSLFSAPLAGLRRAAASHDPWPLHRAEVVELDDELVAAAGLPHPTGAPLVHFSPSVDVRIGWPHACRPLMR